MRTGLTKKQKTTVIYFDEHSRMIEVQTHNTDLKKRLAAFAAKHPQCCRQTDDDEQGGLTFEIEKGRLSFRLTAPYSEERRRAASERAQAGGINSKVYLTNNPYSASVFKRFVDHIFSQMKNEDLIEGSVLDLGYF